MVGFFYLYIYYIKKDGVLMNFDRSNDVCNINSENISYVLRKFYVSSSHNVDLSASFAPNQYKHYFNTLYIFADNEIYCN